MKPSFSFLLTALFALTIPSPMIANNQSNTPAPSKPTTIWLLRKVDNHVQLSLEINGRFSYPFTFTASPKPTSGIGISRTGLISGTPSSDSEQKILVTIKDSNGKLIASYPILLRVTDAQPVMLGSGAVPQSMTPARQAHTSSQAGGDAVSGVAARDGQGGSSSKEGKRPAAGLALQKQVETQSKGASKESPCSPAKQAQSNSQSSILLDPVYEGGDTVSGKELPSDPAPGSSQPKQGKAQSKGASKGFPPVTITCEPGGHAPASSGCRQSTAEVAVDAKKGTFSYQFHAPLYRGDCILVSAGSTQPVKMLVQTPPRLMGEEMHAILGWQQAGASSVDSQDNVFFNFYISRPLAFLRRTEGKHVAWRWWGNVQVASYPQPGNQTLAEAAANLPALLGSVKLNQLAQGAEFRTGIEWQPWNSFSFRGLSENTRQIFTLGFIADFGATGFLSSPSHNAQVFEVPAEGSPQFATFHRFFPGVTSPNVAFISPDFERFPKQYWAGFRLTTHYVDPSGAPLTTPGAMVSFSVGQNQVVTGGVWRGVVGRFEAFYPLPFGNRGKSFLGTLSSVYLFGQAQMRLGGMQTAPPLVLQPATDTPAYDPSVTLVPLASTRDIYRLGFGIDLVHAIAAWTGGAAPKNTTTPQHP